QSRKVKPLPHRRSAELYSAVSRAELHSAKRWEMSVCGTYPASAENNSAIRQIENLRYDPAPTARERDYQAGRLPLRCIRLLRPFPARQTARDNPAAGTRRLWDSPRTVPGPDQTAASGR